MKKVVVLFLIASQFLVAQTKLKIEKYVLKNGFASTLARR